MLTIETVRQILFTTVIDRSIWTQTGKTSSPRAARPLRADGERARGRRQSACPMHCRLRSSGHSSPNRMATSGKPISLGYAKRREASVQIRSTNTQLDG
jgi:hypothetical protein